MNLATINSNDEWLISCGQQGLQTTLEPTNATNGAVNYWVKAPAVSHTSDTMIYLWYGNSSISSNQANATGVWDTNYKGVNIRNKAGRGLAKAVA